MTGKRECVTHHFACDCREEKFAKAEAEVERLKGELNHTDEVLIKSKSALENESNRLRGRIAEMLKLQGIERRTSIQELRAVKETMREEFETELEAEKARAAKLVEALEFYSIGWVQVRARINSYGLSEETWKPPAAIKSDHGLRALEAIAEYKGEQK